MEVVGNKLELPEYFFSPKSQELLIGQQAVGSSVAVTYEPAGIDSIEMFAQTVSNPDIKFTERRYPRSRFANWDMADYRAYGRWLLPLVGELAPELSHHIVLTRSYKLGAGPSRDRIIDPSRFGSVVNFSRQSGQEARARYHLYDDLEFEDAVEHIRKVIEEEGTFKITQDILWRRIKEGREEPSPVIIRRLGNQKFGKNGYSEVLKAAGVRSQLQMTADEYRISGIYHMIENDGRVPTAAELNEKAAAGVGHNTTTIINKYGSLRAYQAELREAYAKLNGIFGDNLKSFDTTDASPAKRSKARDEEQMRSMGKEIKALIEDGVIPISILKGATSGKEIIRRSARFRLITESFGDIDLQPEILHNLSIAHRTANEFISFLAKALSPLSPKLVKLKVVSSSHYDYIF